jgi:hypothetical protein
MLLMLPDADGTPLLLGCVLANPSTPLRSQ